MQLAETLPVNFIARTTRWLVLLVFCGVVYASLDRVPDPPAIKETSATVLLVSADQPALDQEAEPLLSPVTADSPLRFSNELAICDVERVNLVATPATRRASDSSPPAILL